MQWIYDTAPIGLAFLTPDCRYLQINQRLTELCGISVADHLGRTVREMVPNLADQVEKLVQHIVDNGAPVTGIEVNGQRADGIGADRCWLTSWHPLKGPDGRVLGVNVAAEEITERKRAQAAVVASERRYRALAGATTSLVWTAAPDGQFIDASQWRAFTGQSADEVRGMRWLDAVHVYDRDLAFGVWHRSIDRKAPFEVEFRIRRRDGVFKWHRVRGSAVLEDDGTVREWIGVCIDIDERKQAAEQREKLNRSVEQALDLLVSVSAFASSARTIPALASAALKRICAAQGWQFAQVWLPADGPRLMCSRESVWNGPDFAELHRLSTASPMAPGEDLPGRVWETKSATWFEDIAFGDFPRLKAATRAGLRTALVFPVLLGDELLSVFEFFSADQRPPDRTILGAVDQLGRILGDIWVRKRSEAALHVSEVRWRSVFETSALGIMLVDHNLRCVASNRAMQAMMGYSEVEMQRLSPTDFIIEEDRESGRKRLSELQAGRSSSYEVVTRYQRKDGAIIWVNTFVSTIPGDETNPPIYFTTALDITDRHRAESELRRSAAYLSEAEKLSHTGCWARNIKTGGLFWSQEEWRIFGLDPATTQLSYRVFLELVHPEDRASLEENSTRAVRERKPYDIPFRAILRDGTVRHLHSVGKPVFEQSGEVVEYIGVTTDETERIRANAAMHEALAELSRVARLTTMGELTASIAHEINQPLAAVVANGNAALRWLAHVPPNLEETKDALKGIIKEGNRASEVIGGIRGLLRHRKPEYVALDINEAIRDVLALTVSTLRSRSVAVQMILPSDIPHARGDRVQLQQVIMNLIMNGADAMGSVTDRPRILRIGSKVDDVSNIQVTINDSGTGIDEAIRKRIFDPLFTTKPSGMGMGLSICRSIIEAHGGRLWATPSAPHGTDFRFTVPSADPSVAP